MKLGGAGIVDADEFYCLLKNAAEGGALPIVPVLRTLLVEAWFAHLATWTNTSSSSRATARNPVVSIVCDAASSHNFFS
jgi:hypothetical protein